MAHDKMCTHDDKICDASAPHEQGFVRVGRCRRLIPFSLCAGANGRGGLYIAVLAITIEVILVLFVYDGLWTR